MATVNVFVPGQVYETSNYSLFGHIGYNRDVDQKNVRKIMSSIKEHGFFGCIFVDKDMHIIDGQHRLEACKMLGVPVKFCIIDVSHTPELVRDLQVSKKWVDSDMIESLSKCGNILAQQILALSSATNLPKACVASIINTATGSTNGNGSLMFLYDRLVSTGCTKIADDDFSTIMECLMSVSKVHEILHSRYKIVGNTRCVSAVITFAIAKCHVDPDYIVEKFTTAPYTPPCSLYDAIDSVQNVINYRSRNRVYIADAFKESVHKKRSVTASQNMKTYYKKKKGAIAHA